MDLPSGTPEIAIIAVILLFLVALIAGAVYLGVRLANRR